MTHRSTPETDVAPDLTHEDDAALISRVSQARRSGTEDEAATAELLRRASRRNEAALDRLGR